MYNIDDMGDLSSGTFNEFITNYRSALEAQRDSTNKQLDQTRRNYFSSLMGAANRKGMLYSNFPERDKIKYNADTYYPAAIKAQSTYQSGLDTLRNNAISLYNTIKSYNEAIEDLS